jgi:Arc/MetJ family transcription regulator
MKTRVEVDNTLVADALQLSGLTEIEKVIELALKLLIQIKHQEAIKAFRGKLSWEGDLDAMRTDR